MFDLKNICSWGGGVSCKLILSCVTLFTFINLLTWNIIYWIKTKQNTPPPQTASLSASFMFLGQVPNKYIV